jgi:hypothetical protein
VMREPGDSPEGGFNLRGEHVHTPDDEHFIGSAANPCNPWAG